MKVRKTCYKPSDVKMICNNCGTRCFSSSKPQPQDYFFCPNCNATNKLDFTEDKEWYGNYDGKAVIYDILYLDDISLNDIEKIEKNLIKFFHDIRFEDASDEIHGTRRAITLRENMNTYYKQMIKMGLATLSLNFNLYLSMDKNKIGTLIKEIKEEENAL